MDDSSSNVLDSRAGAARSMRSTGDSFEPVQINLRSIEMVPANQRSMIENAKLHMAPPRKGGPDPPLVALRYVGGRHAR